MFSRFINIWASFSLPSRSLGGEHKDAHKSRGWTELHCPARAETWAEQAACAVLLLYGALRRGFCNVLLYRPTSACFYFWSFQLVFLTPLYSPPSQKAEAPCRARHNGARGSRKMLKESFTESLKPTSPVFFFFFASFWAADKSVICPAFEVLVYDKKKRQNPWTKDTLVARKSDFTSDK